MPSSSLLLALGTAALSHAVQLPATSRAGAIAPMRRAVRTGAVEMVTAQEVFSSYLDRADPMQKTMSTVPTPVAQGAMAGVVAASAAVGFVLTPSSRVVVNAVGGALTGALSMPIKKRLAVARKGAAVPAAATLLSGGLASATPEALDTIAKEYGLSQDEFGIQISELYLAYLDACFGSSTVETSELSELLRLQKVLRLSAAQVGNKIYAAARNVYSRHRAYLEEDEDNDSKKLLQKFVFLAERVLRGDDSEEGYQYETKRLQKLFGILSSEWDAMAERAASPFYQKALRSAVIDAKPVTSEQLRAVRASLGITESASAAMHTEIFDVCASGLLQPDLGEGAKLGDADGERIALVASLLGLEQAAVDAQISALTKPLYEATVAAVVAGVEEADERTCAQVSGALAVRQQELRLDTQQAREVEYAALRESAAQKLGKAAELVRIQNVKQALAETQGLVSYAAKMTGLMTQISHVDGDAEAAMATLFGGVTSEAAKPSEVLSLYRTFLLSALSGPSPGISDEASATLSQLRLVLGISEAQSASVYEAAATPLFRKAVNAAIGKELGEAEKAELQASLAGLKLPEEVTGAISLDVYKAKLLEATADDKIIDEAAGGVLLQLRDFLGLAFEQVEPLHASTCAGAYVNSVEEAMGAKGVILDEYWVGLKRLQERLSLGDSTAQTLFDGVAKQKMKGYGEKVVEAMEKKAEQAQKAKKEGKDGGAMGIEAGGGADLILEINNLLEFATNSKVLISYNTTVEGGAEKEVEAASTNLRGELGALELKEMYRQYLVEAFSGNQAAENEKIFANLGKLSLVLGLKEDEIKVIHNEIGSLIYRQYLNKQLKTGPLGEAEFSFLGSVKSALGMEEERCDKLVKEAQLDRVSMMIEQKFELSTVSADDVREIRDAAELYDVDLVDDVQVSQWRLERMFITELEDVVDSGELTPEDPSCLEEICEPLRIDTALATKLTEETVAKRTSAGLLQAAALLRQMRQEEAVDEIDRLLKYAALAPGPANSPAVSKGERQELFLIFQAKLEEDITAPAKLELLREVTGMEAIEA